MLEMERFASAYAAQVIENAKCLAHELERAGFAVFGRERGYTESHAIVVTEAGTDWMRMAKLLFRAGICTNTSSAFGVRGIRVGLQEATRQGMTARDMRTIAGFFKRAVFGEEPLDDIRRDVARFTHQFDRVHFAFETRQDPNAEAGADLDASEQITMRRPCRVA